VQQVQFELCLRVGVPDDAEKQSLRTNGDIRHR